MHKLYCIIVYIYKFYISSQISQDISFPTTSMVDFDDMVNQMLSQQHKNHFTDTLITQCKDAMWGIIQISIGRVCNIIFFWSTKSHISPKGCIFTKWHSTEGKGMYDHEGKYNSCVVQTSYQSISGILESPKTSLSPL